MRPMSKSGCGMEASAPASQNECEQCADGAAGAAGAAGACVSSVGSRFRWRLFLSPRRSRTDGGGSVYCSTARPKRREAVPNGPVFTARFGPLWGERSKNMSSVWGSVNVQTAHLV